MYIYIYMYRRVQTLIAAQRPHMSHLPEGCPACPALFAFTSAFKVLTKHDPQDPCILMVNVTIYSIHGSYGINCSHVSQNKHRLICPYPAIRILKLSNKSCCKKVATEHGLAMPCLDLEGVSPRRPQKFPPQPGSMAVTTSFFCCGNNLESLVFHISLTTNYRIN